MAPNAVHAIAPAAAVPATASLDPARHPTSGRWWVAAAVALKAWWQPSAWLAASVGFDFHTRRPKAGLTFGIENYGNIR